jgi:uncharacterized membrane-anchored protein YitT (DUF2179 family)
VTPRRIFRSAAADWVLIPLGTAVTALGVNLFYAPNRIADGGVTGIGIIVLYAWHIPLWVTITVLNLPLLWWAHRLWGGHVSLRTIVGAGSLSLFLGVLRIPAPTHNLLLATVYGGLLSGAGLGLVFRSRGTTGGTDILARFLPRVLPLSTGQTMLAVDFFVICGMGVMFSPTAAMFSLIALFIATRALDVVQEGIAYERAVLIISDQGEAIGRRVVEELGRGATAWTATGLYTGRARPALYVVVSRSELTRLKAAVQDVDPHAFVVVSPAHEVLGEGFRPFPREL